MSRAFLFLDHWHSLEDTAIAAADTVCRVLGKANVLRRFHIVYSKISGNAEIGFFLIGQIHQRIGNSVRHLIRRAWVHSFKQGVRIPRCNFRSDSGKFYFRAETPGSCS